MNTKVQTIEINHIKVEGLVDQNNKQYIAVVQLNKLFNFSPSNKRSSDYVEKLIGNKYFIKLKTPLHHRDINAIPAEAFPLVLKKLAEENNPIALKLTKTNWVQKLINKVRSFFW